jgi:adhesin transport system outer membrane protein
MIGCLVYFGPVSAQTKLVFKDLLSEASMNYPALRASRLEARAALEDLRAARRLYWPTISVVTEAASSKATSSNPSQYVSVEQTLWDSGRIKSQIAESQAVTDIQTLKAALQQEAVYLELANAWQNMLASKERMNVAMQTMERLHDYQQQMSRRVKVETSPRIDLELANSRILQTQVELISAQYSLKQALTRIEQYTGRQDLYAMVTSQSSLMSEDSLSGFAATLGAVNWQAVVDQHPAIAKVRAEAVQGQTRLDQKKSEAWPQLYVRINQPLYQLAPGYQTGPTAFLGLRYSTSAGFINQLQADALATRVASAQELVHAASTDLLQTLKVEQDELVSARSRIDSLEKTVRGADLVMESYQRQFKAGKKTWQDLLNAVREMAQNQYVLADARASLQGVIYRIQIRTGQDIQ